MSENYGKSQWFNVDGTPVDAETHAAIDQNMHAIMAQRMASLKADIEGQIKAALIPEKRDE